MRLMHGLPQCRHNKNVCIVKWVGTAVGLPYELREDKLALWHCSLLHQAHKWLPTVLVPPCCEFAKHKLCDSDIWHASHMTSPPELHLANNRFNIGHASSVKDFITGYSICPRNTDAGVAANVAVAPNAFDQVSTFRTVPKRRPNEEAASAKLSKVDPIVQWRLFRVDS